MTQQGDAEGEDIPSFIFPMLRGATDALLIRLLLPCIYSKVEQ